MNTKYYEARKKAWTKYNRSKKKSLCNKRYRETHREQCSKWSLEWQRKNREHVRKIERIRNSTLKGKIIRKEIAKRYAEKNRIKRLAKDAVHNAIRAGKLNKMPCVKCGIKKAEGHHPNYTKPLEVIWLCKKHHKEIHKK